MSLRADHEDIVRALIASGESYYCEFKTAWEYLPEGRSPRPVKDVALDVQEALVALANSDGGDVLIGVEDSGTVTGVPYDADRLAYLSQASRHIRPDVGAKVQQVEVDGHRVVWFRVEESAEIAVTGTGRVLWRKGPKSEPVPPQDITRRRTQRSGDTAYESRPVPEATLADLSLPWPEVAQQPHLVRFAERRHVEGLLRYWNLLEGRNGSVALRRAALLLFANEPLRWHPNNRLRLRTSLAEKEGYGRGLATREREFPGPISRTIREATTALGSMLEVERKESHLFARAQLLPSEAVEECIVNAVAHRNYAIEGGAVEVVVYPDRVEFRSPGALPEPLTVADLRSQAGVHRSRNPLIMRVLRDLGYTRDQGEGMRRIFGAMSQVELDEPELEERADFFIVRLSTKSRYDESTQAWLAAFGPFGLEPDERRYVVALRRAGGAQSVDRLARSLGEAFDATKRRLEKLEARDMVWHARGTRTFHLVEPLSVPLERAFKRFRQARIAVGAETTLGPDDLARFTGKADDPSMSSLIDRLRESGVLSPAGKATWRFAPPFLEYVSRRG